MRRGTGEERKDKNRIELNEQNKPEHVSLMPAA
jgi:hypothetical protein